MNTGLPAYQTSELVAAGRISVSGTLCHYNAKARVGWRVCLHSQSVYKWNVSHFLSLSFLLKVFFLPFFYFRDEISGKEQCEILTNLF